MSAKQGVAKARKILSSHDKFGARLGVLNFQPINAAKLNCEKVNREYVCQVGADIDPREIRLRTRYR